MQRQLRVLRQHGVFRCWVDKVAELAKPEFKARMAVKWLAVAGAFHTDFMAPAVAAVRRALADTDVKARGSPSCPTSTRRPTPTRRSSRTSSRRSRSRRRSSSRTVANLLGAGFARRELGPGKVIAGIFKRIDKTASVENVVV